MTAAATATAEIEANLGIGKNDLPSGTCRKGTSNKQQPSNASNRHSSYNGADPLENNHSNSFILKARREFLQDLGMGAGGGGGGGTGDLSRNRPSITTTSECEYPEDIHSRRRSSGNGSVFGGGRVTSSCPQSPDTKVPMVKNGGAFSSASSSSSATSLTFSSGASLGWCNGDPRSAYTDDILKVLEEDGLIIQTCAPDNLLPLPVSLSDRRASADYNVIELSRQYRKKELSQMRSSADRFQHVSDIYRLQQMLASTDDEDKRRAIKQRLVELRTNKENSQRNGQRARSLSTREVVTHSEGSPVKDSTMLGGIASLTVSPYSGTARSSPTSSPANGCRGGTPNGQTIKIIARTPTEIKAALLRWCQIKTRGYAGVLITNFTKSWSDGMAFCALVHHFFPDAFDYSKLHAKNRRDNFELAFRVAEEMAGIVPLLEVDDMISMGDNPEYKCIYTYIQSMYKNLHQLDR